MLTQAQTKHLAECKARLERVRTDPDYRYPSADAYYADKDDVRRLEAKIAGKTASQHDPMGYWYGGQSN